jgi:hypothetical protein
MDSALAYQSECGQPRSLISSIARRSSLGFQIHQQLADAGVPLHQLGDDAGAVGRRVQNR